MVGMWSILTGARFLSRWAGTEADEWAADWLRSRSGVLFWPLSFLLFHVLPQLLLSLLAFPAIAIVASPGSAARFHWVELAPGLVCAAGLALSFASWLELVLFRDAMASRSMGGRAPLVACTTGPFSLCSRPAHLGDWLVWAGLAAHAAVVSAANPGALQGWRASHAPHGSQGLQDAWAGAGWFFAGPAAYFVYMRLVEIPWTDARRRAKSRAFAAVQRDYCALLPVGKLFRSRPDPAHAKGPGAKVEDDVKKID